MDVCISALSPNLPKSPSPITDSPNLVPAIISFDIDLLEASFKLSDTLDDIVFFFGAGAVVVVSAMV